MRRSNFATILYLIVVFASGAVVGGFGVRLYMAKSVSAVSQSAPRNRAEIRREYVQEMRTRLHLTEPQVTELQKILDATGQRMHEMHKTIGDEHTRQVTAILDENQKVEYAKILVEREKRRQESSKK